MEKNKDSERDCVGNQPASLVFYLIINSSKDIVIYFDIVYNTHFMIQAF